MISAAAITACSSPLSFIPEAFSKRQKKKKTEGYCPIWIFVWSPTFCSFDIYLASNQLMYVMKFIDVADVNEGFQVTKFQVTSYFSS